MRYLPDGQQMKKADEDTVSRLGISSMELMERAGAAFVETLKEKGENLSSPCVVCGAGNNGGDGFVIGRILLLEGSFVTLVFAGEESRLTKEGRRKKELFEKAGGEIINSFPEGEYSIIIDALLGAGANRRLKGIYADMIEKMNRAGGRKAAVDLPSGISSFTGETLGVSFRADFTVAFQCAKLGSVLYPGSLYTGEIIVKDIGIDTTSFSADKGVAVCLETSDIKAFLPKRPPNAHKGSFGRTLVIAGSKGMAGAAYLNAFAAYMTGAGLVRIYTPKENLPILQQLLPEALAAPYTAADEEEILSLLAWADAVCIGSGMGTGETAEKILEIVLRNVKTSCVVDADGLNLLAGKKELLTVLPHENFIFTPHMKEMGRLLGMETEVLRKRKMEEANAFANEYSVVCVLKDARTYVTGKKERTCVNLSGNSSMAKAGAGDVLTGVIAGLLSQGASCFRAASLGVYLHGLSGDVCQEKKGNYSVLARDLAENLSDVLKKEGTIL